jgi:hypothetical protein
MSDMSCRWCRTCKLPEFACWCDDEDQNLEIDSPVVRKLADPEAPVWEEEHFYGR